MATYYGYTNSCGHVGDQPLFIIGDRSFGGAGQTTMTANYDVNLKCNGLSSDTSRKLIKASKKYAALEKFGVPRDVVSIDWQDMGTPGIQPQFWKAFIDALPEKCHVVVNCVGGHGRTGTALACLYLVYAEDTVTGWDAIEFVRNSYCDKAIETDGQERYVLSIAKFYGKQEGKPTAKKKKSKAKKSSTGSSTSLTNQPTFAPPYLQFHPLIFGSKSTKNSRYRVVFQYGTEDSYVEVVGDTQPDNKNHIKLVGTDIDILQKCLDDDEVGVASFDEGDKRDFVEATHVKFKLGYITEELRKRLNDKTLGNRTGGKKAATTH